MLLREDGGAASSIVNEWRDEMSSLAAAILSQEMSCRVELNESVEVFLELMPPPPTVIAVGGVHVAMVLVSLAKRLGYRTVVIDPRKAWGNAQRFPDVDQLIQAWPEDAFQQVSVTPRLRNCHAYS